MNIRIFTFLFTLLLTFSSVFTINIVSKPHDASSILSAPPAYADDNEEREYQYEEEDHDGGYRIGPDTSRLVSSPIPVVATLDTTAPIIHITSPREGEIFSAETSNVTLMGIITDNQDAHPIVSGIGTFSLKDGQNVFVVTATDKSGNISTASVSVTRKPRKESIVSSQTIADSDGDGLNDFEEGIFKTNPLLADSDEDGVSDMQEILGLMNPNGKGTFFVDVSRDNFIQPYLGKMILEHVINGYSDKTFKPNSPITRAEAIKILSSNVSTVNSENISSHFSDVSPSDWFFQYVAQANTSGVVKGKSDGLFHPNDLVTRSEMIKMTLSSFGIGSGYEANSPKIIHFSDLDQTGWDAVYVETALENGIIKGYTNGQFGGSQPVTRAEAVAILARTQLEFTNPEKIKTVALLSPNERVSLIAKRVEEQKRLEQIAKAQADAQARAQAQKVIANQKKIITVAPKTPPTKPVSPPQNISSDSARAQAEANARAQAEAMARAAAQAAAQKAIPVVVSTPVPQTQTKAS